MIYDKKLMEDMCASGGSIIIVLRFGSVRGVRGDADQNRVIEKQ